MNQIFLDGKPCQLFFSETSSIDSIIEYIRAIVLFDDYNLFGLNEPYSCYAFPHMGDIVISGYQDYKVLTIVKIEPIKR